MMSSAANRPVLVVEDNAAHYEALVRAFQTTGCSRPLVRCCDGDAALEYLLGSVDGSGGNVGVLPALVLLDLNLPGTDGHEVLDIVKQNVWLKRVPVVVMTTTAHPPVVRRCYDSGANGFLKKPASYEGLIHAARLISDFWCDLNELCDESAPR